MRTHNPPPLKACRFDSDLGHQLHGQERHSRSRGRVRRASPIAVSLGRPGFGFAFARIGRSSSGGRGPTINAVTVGAEVPKARVNSSRARAMRDTNFINLSSSGTSVVASTTSISRSGSGGCSENSAGKTLIEGRREARYRTKMRYDPTARSAENSRWVRDGTSDQ